MVKGYDNLQLGSTTHYILEVMAADESNDGSCIPTNLSEGGTTISKMVGGRFGGLELRDIENAGGQSHFDDNTTICPDKDEFDYAYAYFCREIIYDEEVEFNDELCDGETHTNTGRVRCRISELSSLNRDDCAPRYSDGGLFVAFRNGTKSSMKKDVTSLCDTQSSTDGNSSHPGSTQWKMNADVHFSSINDTILSRERHPALSPSPINNKHRRIEGSGTHSQISTNDTSNRSEGFGMHVYRYFKDSSNKAITILVVFTSVVVLVCFTTIMIEDFNEKQRNGNGIGVWSKNNDAVESEESRHQSISPDDEFADASPTLSPTVEVTFRNIFESDYSRGTDSPSPTILKPDPTSYPSPSPIDLAEEFLAIDIPPLPSSEPVSTPWSQHPSRSPATLHTPHLSKEPTLRPSPQPSKIHPTVMPTGNPSMRPSPFPNASPTFPPRYSVSVVFHCFQLVAIVIFLTMFTKFCRMSQSNKYSVHQRTNGAAN